MMLIKSRSAIGFFVVMVVAIGGLAGVLQAAETVGGMVRGLMPYGASHELSVADPCYYTDFGSSVQEFNAEVWAVAGLSGTQTGPGSGTAEVMWHGPGQVRVGTYMWPFGTIIYHVYTDDLFLEGTAYVEMDLHYAGDPDDIKISTSAVEPTDAGGYGNRWAYYTWQAYDTVYPDTAGSTVYSIATPPGKDIYIAIGRDAGDSHYSYISSIDIRPVVVIDPDGCVNAVTGDINSDCVTDLNDFALVASNWMECNDVNNPQECPPEALPDAR